VNFKDQVIIAMCIDGIIYLIGALVVIYVNTTVAQRMKTAPTPLDESARIMRKAFGWPYYLLKRRPL
jgi:hypothetical protein